MARRFNEEQSDREDKFCLSSLSSCPHSSTHKYVTLKD